MVSGMSSTAGDGLQVGRLHPSVGAWVTTTVRGLRVLVSGAITGSEGGGLGNAVMRSIRRPIMAHVAATSPTNGGGTRRGGGRRWCGADWGGSRSGRVSGKVRVIGRRVRLAFGT